MKKRLVIPGEFGLFDFIDNSSPYNISFSNGY